MHENENEIVDGSVTISFGVQSDCAVESAGVHSQCSTQSGERDVLVQLDIVSRLDLSKLIEFDPIVSGVPIGIIKLLFAFDMCVTGASVTTKAAGGVFADVSDIPNLENSFVSSSSAINTLLNILLKHTELLFKYGMVAITNDTLNKK